MDVLYAWTYTCVENRMAKKATLMVTVISKVYDVLKEAGVSEERGRAD